MLVHHLFLNISERLLDDNVIDIILLRIRYKLVLVGHILLIT